MSIGFQRHVRHDRSLFDLKRQATRRFVLAGFTLPLVCCTGDRVTEPDTACGQLTGTVTGTVYLGEDLATTAAHARLSFQPNTGTVMEVLADSDGRFSSAIEEGSWTVTAESQDGYCESSESTFIEVDPCDTQTVDLHADACILR